MNQRFLEVRTLTPLVAALFGSIPATGVAQAKLDVPLASVSEPEAVTTDPFGVPGAAGRFVYVRQLNDGTVLVNDAVRRKVIALDAFLQNRVVVLDTFTTVMGYGRSPATIAQYFGDSLVVASRTSMSVLDASGRVIRWTPATANQLITLNVGQHFGVDRAGNFVFQARVSQRPSGNAVNPSASMNGASSSTSVGQSTGGAPGSPNSATIVRANFATRAVKPVAQLLVEPTASVSTNASAEGKLIARTVVNALPRLDEYEILSDGTVAVVRQSDYHIEFYRSDGRADTTARLPFNWRPLSITERQAIVDSVRDVQARAAAAGIKTPEREIAAVMAGVAMANATGVNTGRPGEGFSVNVVRADSVAAGVASRQPGQAPSAPAPAAIPFGISTSDLEYVAASNLPDRYPAFLANAVSVDRDDNLWIRTTVNDPINMNLTMYDVVDRTGALIRRVRIPSSRTIAGFGTDGSVFLRFAVESGWMLERTRLIK